MTKRERKKCNVCFPRTGKEKLITDFYTSTSILFADGRVPICKSCLKGMMDEKDINSVKMTLQKIDKPFIAKVWKSSEESDEETIGTYFRMVNSFNQYKNATWADSDIEGESNTQVYQHKFDNVDNIEELETDYGTIFLNQEIIMKFGSGYLNREHLQMEKFYRDMCMTHDINTPQLKKQLVYLCKLQIQMDRAIESSESGDFKKYSDSYEAILKSSALAPKDRKSLDESSGIRSFGVIFEEVEKRGYVEPYNLEENQDIVDKTIMYMLNYTRQLVGVQKMSEPPNDTPDVGDEYE